MPVMKTADIKFFSGRPEDWQLEQLALISQAFSRVPGQKAMALRGLSGVPAFTLGINAQEVFPAASVIKLAILGELFRRFQESSLNPETMVTVRTHGLVEGAGVLFECGAGKQFSLRELARLMIVVSDNEASNMLIDLLTPQAINHYCHIAGAEQTLLARRFMDFSHPQRENTLTAYDALQLMQPFCDTSLLNTQWAREALDILHRQQFIEKIPSRLCDCCYTANKTGELDGVRHDVAYIKYGTVVFSLAVLTRNVEKSWEADAAIGELAECCWRVLMATQAHSSEE